MNQSIKIISVNKYPPQKYKGVFNTIRNKDIINICTYTPTISTTSGMNSTNVLYIEYSGTIPYLSGQISLNFNCTSGRCPGVSIQNTTTLSLDKSNNPYYVNLWINQLIDNDTNAMITQSYRPSFKIMSGTSDAGISNTSHELAVIRPHNNSISNGKSGDTVNFYGINNTYHGNIRITGYIVISQYAALTNNV